MKHIVGQACEAVWWEFTSLHTGNELGMLSQSPVSSLLCWSFAHWLKRVASVLSDVPLLVATLRAESWALIRVLRSAQLRYVALTWLLSPPLARATNDRIAVIFQPLDSYTCSTIQLEHRLYAHSCQLSKASLGHLL